MRSSMLRSDMLLSPGKVNLSGSDVEVRQVVATQGEDLQQDGVGLDVGGDVAQCACGSVAELGHI